MAISLELNKEAVKALLDLQLEPKQMASVIFNSVPTEYKLAIITKISSCNPEVAVAYCKLLAAGAEGGADIGAIIYNEALNLFLHPTGASSLKEAQAQKAERVVARRLMERAMEFGHPRSMAILGDLFRRGDCGAMKSTEKAMELYKKAMDAGDLYAKARYITLTFPNDLGKLKSGFELFKQVADLENDSTAQAALGMCYDQGRGVETNQVEAFKCYRLSATRGNPLGQYNLGFCYKEGDGVAKNLEEAKNWFMHATNQGFEAAADALEDIAV